MIFHTIFHRIFEYSKMHFCLLNVDFLDKKMQIIKKHTGHLQHKIQSDVYYFVVASPITSDVNFTRLKDFPTGTVTRDWPAVERHLILLYICAFQGSFVLVQQLLKHLQIF